VAIALLDVNMLVALFREIHVHHDVAHDWFADHGDQGWASCPLTENGVVRILSSPGVNPYVPAFDVVGLLARFCEHSAHSFWRDELSLRDEAVFDLSAVRGPKQLTDVYLLGVAVKHGGRLVTLDQRIPLAAVKGARKQHLEVIAPVE
jgi:uncharacterized protein